MKKLNKRLLVAAMLCALCAQSFAQFGGGRRGRTPDANSTQSADTNLTPAARANQVADKLYNLRIQLQITPEQSNVWEDFYAKAMAWSQASFRGRMAVMDQPVLQTMQQRLDETRNRFTLMQALSEAVKTLYAGLSPEQRRTADQDLAAVIP